MEPQEVQWVQELITHYSSKFIWEVIKIALWVAPIMVLTIWIKDGLLGLGRYQYLRTVLSVDSHYIINGCEGILKEIKVRYIKLVEVVDNDGDKKLLKVHKIPCRAVTTITKITQQSADLPD